MAIGECINDQASGIPPSANQDLRSRCWNHIVAELSRCAVHRDAADRKLDLWLVSLTKIRRLLGREGGRGAQTYVFDRVMLEDPPWQIIERGQVLKNSPRLTRVRLLWPITNAMIGEKLVSDIWKDHEANPDLYDVALIDSASLANFIAWVNNDRLKEQAQRIQAQTYQGRLPQRRSQSYPGARIYYQGTSLQIVDPWVRVAALGDCHAYDLRSCMFVWQLHMLRKFTGQGRNSEIWSAPPGTIYLREWLRDRALVVKILARHLQPLRGSPDYKHNLIKQVITAMAFGARKNQSGHYWHQGRWHNSSIRDLIPDPEAHAALISDPWIQGFHAEQLLIQRRLAQGLQQLFPGSRHDARYARDDGGYSQARYLALQYQEFETAVMDELILPQIQPGNLLLRVHDGFYTRQAIDMIRINSDIQACVDGLHLRHTQHHRWRPPVDDSDANIRHQQELAWHLSQGREPQQGQSYTANDISSILEHQRRSHDWGYQDEHDISTVSDMGHYDGSGLAQGDYARGHQRH